MNRFVMYTPQRGAIEGNTADDLLLVIRDILLDP
jgi:hypothetical protein